MLIEIFDLVGSVSDMFYNTALLTVDLPSFSQLHIINVNIFVCYDLVIFSIRYSIWPNAE
jgi:hypothetical protein